MSNLRTPLKDSLAYHLCPSEVEEVGDGTGAKEKKSRMITPMVIPAVQDSRGSYLMPGKNVVIAGRRDEISTPQCRKRSGTR